MIKFIKQLLILIILGALLYLGWARVQEYENAISPDPAATSSTSSREQLQDLFDISLGDEIARVLELSGYQQIDLDRLSEKSRERIKRITRDQVRELEADWQSRLQQAIDEIITELEKSGPNSAVPEKKTFSASTTESAGIYALDDLLAPGEEHDKDENGCLPGYHLDGRSVIGCVQTGCAQVEHARYSYDGNCVCGSSGSINEKPADPNQECRLPWFHRSCPNCTFLCLGDDGQCPIIRRQ